MIENLETRISRLIETIWAEVSQPAGYIALMREAIFAGCSDEGNLQLQLPIWVQLPDLCCQAAGGQVGGSDAAAAAWFLLSAAAHILDTVEDMDPPDPWWKDLGPGVAINAATGLIFSADAALQLLEETSKDLTLARQVRADFQSTLLQMSAGQHRDLTLGKGTLEGYWQVAAQKSGNFFALACRSGARFAQISPNSVQAYGDFGLHLGLLVQLLDDLEPIQRPAQTLSEQTIREFCRILPVVYAMNVLSNEERERLASLLRSSIEQPGAFDQSLELVETSGAALYLAAEMEHHRSSALAALEKADPRSPWREQLESLVRNVGTKE